MITRRKVTFAFPHILRSSLLAILLTSLQGGLSLAQESHQKVVKRADLTWGHLNPRRGDAAPAAANIWGDRTKKPGTGFLVKFKDGFASPPHIHNVTYKGVVLEGLVHNDDPKAEPMWMPPGSFWTQPAGEIHITASKGESIAYIEIDSGPYLVLPSEKAFDKGERPVNIVPSNIIWQDALTSRWIKHVGDEASPMLSFLWGKPDDGGEPYGSFLKLPAGFDGSLSSEGSVHAVVIKGETVHEGKDLEPGSYFGSAQGKHHLTASEETILYLRAKSPFTITTANP